MVRVQFENNIITEILNYYFYKYMVYAHGMNKLSEFGTGLYDIYEKFTLLKLMSNLCCNYNV